MLHGGISCQKIVWNDYLQRLKKIAKYLKGLSGNTNCKIAWKYEMQWQFAKNVQKDNLQKKMTWKALCKNDDEREKKAERKKILPANRTGREKKISPANRTGWATTILDRAGTCHRGRRVPLLLLLVPSVWFYKRGTWDIKEIVWVQTWFSQPHVLPPPFLCPHSLSLLALHKPEHEIMSQLLPFKNQDFQNVVIMHLQTWSLNTDPDQYNRHD